MNISWDYLARRKRQFVMVLGKWLNKRLNRVKSDNWHTIWSISPDIWMGFHRWTGVTSIIRDPYTRYLCMYAWKCPESKHALMSRTPAFVMRHHEAKKRTESAWLSVRFLQANWSPKPWSGKRDSAKIPPSRGSCDSRFCPFGAFWQLLIIEHA